MFTNIYTKLWHNILYRSNFRSFWEEIYKSYFYQHKAEKIMYFEYFKGYICMVFVQKRGLEIWSVPFHMF